jgi:uncharacterized protein
MLLDLTRYRQPIARFSRSFPPGEVAQAGDAYRIAAPVDLDLEIRKDRDRFRLTGRAQTVLELSCSRCLEPFTMPVDVAIDLQYVPASAMKTEAEREVQDEDFETSYYRDDRIDLNELLREQFYLQLPMKPLCRDDCRGLCPHCGTNLNTGSCDCPSQWTDPRLAPLERLREPPRNS